MGQARLKRMRREAGEIEVICPGMLEVLSVGKGDLKITIGCDDPVDIEKGRKIIEEMLRKGYAIFVETDKGPTRVKRFNPKRFTYIISELAEEESPAPKRPPGRFRKVVEKEIPVTASKARAIGRTAGG